ncbi:hypothetical protein JCM6882_007018 [Rhodosporidiobolus microsporus]
MDPPKARASFLKLLGAVALQTDAANGLDARGAKRFGQEVKELVEEAHPVLPTHVRAALSAIAVEFSSGVAVPLPRCITAMSTVTSALGALASGGAVTRPPSLDSLPAELVSAIIDAAGEDEQPHSRVRQQTAKSLSETCRILHRTALPVLSAEAHFAGSARRISQVAQQVAAGHRSHDGIRHLSAVFTLEELELRGGTTTTWPGLDLASLVYGCDRLQSLHLKLYTSALRDDEEGKLCEVLGTDPVAFCKNFIKPSLQHLWLPQIGAFLEDLLLDAVREPHPSLRTLRLGHVDSPALFSAQAAMWDRANLRKDAPPFISFSTLALPWYAFSTASFLALMDLFDDPSPPTPPPPHPLEHLEVTLHFPWVMTAAAASAEISSICQRLPSIRRLSLRIFFRCDDETVQAAFCRSLVRSLQKCTKLEHLEIGGRGLSTNLPRDLTYLAIRTLVFLPTDDSALTPGKIFEVTDDLCAMGLLEKLVVCLPDLSPGMPSELSYDATDIADFLGRAKEFQPPVQASVQCRKAEDQWVRHDWHFRP